MDIEWAHAMAPGAKIYLVEAASNSFADLLTAVNVASNLVAAAGGGEVSMSWGGSEFAFQKLYDGYFTKSGVVYVAAAGDSAGTIWPSTSPNVVSAGGTTNSRDANGDLQAQLAWSSTGGGPSKYEFAPILPIGDFQNCRQQEGTPDVAADADPDTGVWALIAAYCGGGALSAALALLAPVWAGYQCRGPVSVSSRAELSTIYSNLGEPPLQPTLLKAPAALTKGTSAKTGWDFCTGAGSADGTLGK